MRFFIYVLLIFFTSYISVLNAALVFEDKKGLYTPQKIIEDSSVFKETDKMSYGFSESVFWLKIDLKNNSEKVDDFYVSFDYPLLKHVDAYIKDNDEILLQSNGYGVPVSKRKVKNESIIISTQLDPNSSKTLFIRVQNDYATHLDYKILDDEEFHHHIEFSKISVVFLISALLTLSLYNLFLYIYTRDATYGYYVGYMLCAMFAVIGTFNKTGSDFLSENVISFIFVGGASLYVFAFLFNQAVFKETSTKLTQRVKWIMITLVLLHLPFMFISPEFAMQIYAFYGSGAVITGGLLWLNWHAYKQGHPLAKFIAIGWGVFLLSTILYILNLAGILGVEFQHAFAYGSVIEGLIFSLALAYRIRTDERKIAQQNDFIQSALDKIKDAAYMANPDGSFYYVNAAAVTNLGYTKEELMKLKVLDVDCDTDPEMFEKQVWPALLKDKSIQIEAMHQRKDGSTFPVEIVVSLIEYQGKEYAFGIARDITERKEAEEKLQQFNEKLERRVKERTSELERSEAMLNEAQSLGKIGAWTYDIATQNTYWSDELYVIHGIDIDKSSSNIDEYIEKSIECYQPHESRQKVIDEFNKLVQDGTPYDSTYQFKSYDGQDKWVRVISRAIFEDTKPSVVIGILQDITKEKKEEQELIEAKELAETAVKAKSEFLANMSHEIRTPMNAIIGMTNLALQEELDDKIKNYVQKANMAGENLLRIINDILDFSKIEAGKLELSDRHFVLTDVIRDVLDLINIAAKKKGLKTKVIIDKSIPDAFCADSLRLSQVLINLASNAVKFSNENASITFSVSLEHENKDDALLKFSVEDEGIGIADENQKKLFESFSQAESSTTRKFGGTGLGLVISKKIVELMGGEIWLESEKGKGSSFFFTIRMKKSTKEKIIEVAKEDENNEQQYTDKLKDIKILLVEDNEMNQELVTDLLKPYSPKLVIANNGKEALEVIEKEEFDIILMDIQMPVMDGYEATKHIREKHTLKNIPIIAMTANVMSDDIKKSKEVGMNDHIGKPIDPHDMFKKIAKWTSKS